MTYRPPDRSGDLTADLSSPYPLPPNCDGYGPDDRPHYTRRNYR